MEIKTINAALCAKMFLGGAKNLEANKEWINELNVFPVPDGDTGTNMTLTITSAAKEVASLENPEMEPLCKAISSGSLRGARGNSGVILSQLLRGFTKGIKKYNEIDADVYKRQVLAMVSKPDFDPASISEDWETLNSENSGSPLLNRAVQGLYPPGSTFKILTTLAYMRQHPGDYQNFTFNCEGLVSKDDVNITCYAGSVHGLEDLETAFKNSCNGAFATIGMELDNSEFKKICESFGFNKDLSIHMLSLIHI